MNNGNPTGEVRPMIDREPPNAAETRGASVRTRFCETSGLVRAPGALPIALERRIVGFQKPATGESRFKRLSDHWPNGHLDVRGFAAERKLPVRTGRRTNADRRLPSEDNAL